MSSSVAHRQLSLDVEEEVFRHLLFHRSLIDDGDGDMYGRIERYLNILSELKEGAHIAIRDSYSRSIAMILELATGSYLDPWDVDLGKFCKMFMKKLRGQERLNLIVIGKLIRMAYSVLYMKSSDTLRKAEMSPEDDRIDEDPFYGWMEDDETFEVTKNILRQNEPPIVESVLHKGDRPVTLVDLLNALEDVEDEISLLKMKRNNSIKARKLIDLHNRENIDENIYKENMEEDIKLTWQRVNQFNGHPIRFSEIDQGFELDANSTFISLLYLANWERVKVWQRSFPRGEIMIRNISKDRGDLEFGELEENMAKAKEGEVRVVRPDEMIVEKRPIPGNWNT